MHAMFDGASSFNQNIGGWNTGGVTDVRNGGRPWHSSYVLLLHCSFFQGPHSLLHLFPLQFIGLICFDWTWTSQMYSMFEGASSFNQNIRSWNTASVTRVRGWDEMKHFTFCLVTGCCLWCYDPCL